jgi:hypothetical protein
VTPHGGCFLYLVDGMQFRNVRLQKRIDERFHQRGQKFAAHSLLLSLSGPAKVENCGIEVRASQTRKKKKTLYILFFQLKNVDKMEIPQNNKQRRGYIHTHAHTKRERET